MLLIRNGNATAEIRIESDDRIVISDRGFNEAFAIFNDDGDVKLYHNGNQKLATTSTGIDVTGIAVVDGLTSSAAITSTSNSNSLGGTTFTSVISGTTASMSGSITVSGNSNTFGSSTISGNLSVDGGTIKLDGDYPTGTDNVALGNGCVR